MALFRKKKNKEKTKVNEDITGQSVTIRIFRDLGSNVPRLVVEFEATEKRDSFGGLVIESNKYNFLEDVEFQKADIFNQLTTVLEISDKSKEEKLKLIDKKIRHQKKLLNYLDKFVELNSLYSYPDEKYTLSCLTVLYDYVKNISEGKGSYFTIEKGKRVYSFVKKNGQYHPIWHGISDHTTHPSYVNKHKIKQQEDEIFKSEWGEFFRKNIAPGSILIAGLILILLTGIMVYGIFHVMDKSQTLDQQINSNAIQCAEQYSRITSQMNELIEIEVLGKALNRSLEQDPQRFDQINDEVVQLEVG